MMMRYHFQGVLMRNKNLLILLAAAALIALAAVLALVMQPGADSLPQNSQPTQGVQAYMLITVDGETKQPIPLTEEAVFNLNQDNGYTNTVHVTPTSMWVESANCHSQDCIEQGVVSLDTMNERVLGNLIVCLPHKLTLELYSAAEMEAMLSP